jgi:Baseplate J-like protein
LTVPPIETRSAEDFLRVLHGELGPYQDAGPVGLALSQILARYAELIADRLNRAPDKLFLAYLDLLGASLRPPEPARVPLTFYLAEGAANAYVKRGAQVEAIRGPADKEPVVFETETDLRVTSARLDSIIWKDPLQDEYAELSAVAECADAPPAPLFRTSAEYPGVRTPHELMIGVRVPERLKELDRVRFQFRLTGPAISHSLAWEQLAKGVWSPFQPAFDTTSGFARNGDVLFASWTPPEPEPVLGIPAQWFRCRSLDALAPSTATSALPVIESVKCLMEARKTGLRPERVYTTEALDPTREMWIFGARPVYGSTFYLRHDEAFGVPGAQVGVAVQLVNPRNAQEPPPLSPVNPIATRLVWETWEGQQWISIGSSQANTVVAEPARGFEDGTECLSQDGEVRFRLPDTTAPVVVAGEKGFWIRVRMVGGDYGREASYVPNTAGALVYTPATLAPPVVRSFQLSFQSQVEAQTPFLVRNHDFQLENLTDALPVRPFQPIAEAEADSGLYFGFSMPAAMDEAVAPVELSLYFQVSGKGAISGGLGTEVSWELPDATGAWVSLPLRDHTVGLSKSGMVRSTASFSARPRTLFGRSRFWVRLRPLGPVAYAGMIEAALMNTVPALNVRTTENEIIGSANSTAGQTFRSARSPVLPGQQLQVLEPELPSAAERAAIFNEEGLDAIEPTQPGQGPGVWVRWHEMPDFRASQPRDRHYVVDRLAGQIQFGNGAQGLPPPAGTSNVRLRWYRTGGGSSGNKPANTVTNLKSSAAHVDKVRNYFPASGGSDTESLAELRARFPSELRHHDRAVTPEDYEDLAKAASRQVNRARCVPLYDLGADPAGKRRVPGTVSLIILPHSLDARPDADTELLARVQDYVGERQPPTARLVVVTAEYVRIDVEAEVVVGDLADRGRVESQVIQALREFLHPCTGRQGEGWDFGRVPKHSDIYSILEAIPGLSYVFLLRINKAAERAGAEEDNRFVIYCGEPSVTVRVGD